MRWSRLVRCIGWVLGGLVSCGVAWGTADLHGSLERTVDRSVLMGEAIVSEVRSGWSEAAGTRTYVRLKWISLDRGPLDAVGSEVVVREFGGRFGDRVLVVPEAPTYRTGERVYVMLSAGADGALRTTNLSAGKLTADAGGGWRYANAPGARADGTVSVADLAGLAGRRAPERSWRAYPAEWDRIEWEPASRFTLLDQASPARWAPETRIDVHVDVTDHPFLDESIAMELMGFAAASWSSVPTARVDLRVVPEPIDHRALYGRSPATHPSNHDVILFGDPYDDIDDPQDCSGVIAMGGYWRTAEPTTALDDVPVYGVTNLFVIFNNGFECFLADPLNAIEVATHELGHGIGLGHSQVPDSIMRTAPYGDRGARLGSDDEDGAQCLYPQVIELQSGIGGETWFNGIDAAIDWRSGAAETHGHHGAATVDLMLSRDDGVTWEPLATGVPDVGRYVWRTPTWRCERLRIRIDYSLSHDTERSSFPEACGRDASSDPILLRPPRRGERGFRPKRDGRFAEPGSRLRQSAGEPGAVR